eukprot:1028515-Ditylum_brightwellii.AAC.1
MVDHATSFVNSHLIRGTALEETMAVKEAYQRVLNKYGHRAKSYHGDNSRFDSSEFQESCKKAWQSFSYCGVGAHHQNSIAEAMNKCLTHGARTSLLCAKRKWPKGWSPLERILGYKDEIVAEDFHTQGCPVNVLDSSLQTGTGIGPPKWDPGSRAGVYLGHSLHHAGNIALVLNLQTGHMSPQYHLVFDNEFTTVPYMNSAETPPNWATL